MKKFMVNGISIEAEDANDARQIFLDNHLDVQEETAKKFKVDVFFYKGYTVEAEGSVEAENQVVALASEDCKVFGLKDGDFGIDGVEPC